MIKSSLNSILAQSIALKHNVLFEFWKEESALEN